MIRRVHTLKWIGGLIGVLLAFTAFSGTAHAQVATTTSVCTPQVQNFVPYIYEDGNLHSFDYIYTGEGYPSIVSTHVGDFELDSRYTTIWNEGAYFKVHTDVPSWFDLGDIVPVSTTILMPNGCVDTYNFTISLPKKAPVSSVTTPATTPQNPETPSQSTPGEGEGLTLECTPTGALLSWEAQPGANSYVIERKTGEQDFSAIRIIPT